MALPAGRPQLCCQLPAVPGSPPAGRDPGAAAGAGGAAPAKSHRPHRPPQASAAASSLPTAAPAGRRHGAGARHHGNSGPARPRR